MSPHSEPELTSLSMLLLMTVAQAQEPPPLSYDAPSGCPDAGAFTSELAARLGTDPFPEGADRQVQVRVGDIGGGLVLGTLSVAGRTKSVEGERCQDVFESLVVAAAVLLDNEQIAPQPQRDPNMAYLNITSNTPDVSMFLMSEVSLEDYYQGIREEDLCTAPCEVAVEPGYRMLVARGLKLTPARQEVQLSAGSVTHLHADMHSRTRRNWGVALTLLGVNVLTMATFISNAPTDADYEGGIRPSTTVAVVSGGVTALGAGLFVSGQSYLRKTSSAE